jgi:hypothetical protein
MRLALGGHRVGFTALARAFDSRRTEPVSEFRRKVRTLTGNFQLCAWLPAVLVPGRNPVWLQFVVHKLLRLLTPWLLVGLFIGLAGWCLVNRPLWLGIALGSALVVAIVAFAAGRARLSPILWFVVMLGALVVATYNGFRGRWDVWSRQ